MMAIEDAGKRYPQQFRIVCSAGEPLNPEAIRWFREPVRRDGARLLRAHRVLSAVRELPVHGGARGLDGQADAGLGRADPRRGRAARSRQGERGEICLRARSNPHYPLGYWNRPGGHRGDLRRRVVPHQGRRRAGRGRLLLVRGARRRRDHLGRLPDRAVRGRVGLHRAPGRARGGGRRLTRRAARQRRQGVRRAGRGPRALRRAGRRDQALRARAPSPPTPIRAGSSSSTTCRRRSPARSAGSSCASASTRASSSACARSGGRLRGLLALVADRDVRAAVARADQDHRHHRAQQGESGAGQEGRLEALGERLRQLGRVAAR